MKLIYKDDLVSDIKERIETYNKGYANGDDKRADTLEILLHDLNTIEVKEVDLETEFESYMDRYNGVWVDSDYIRFAKHFFELGLKTQKGE